MKKIHNTLSDKMEVGEATLNVCLGSGLVALDVIVNGNPSTPAKLCAGGSCGNVLSILSFLGWKSSPIARLSNNNASENLLNDFKKFNVNTSLISCTSDGSTPIIIHRILKDKFGNPKHKFEFKIPETGVWLPQYKPTLKTAVDSIINEEPTANVFFFDRISRSALNLAKYYKSKGALIVFEPSSMKNDKAFQEALALANIVKFSHERIANYDTEFPQPMCDLEIQTLGKDGLKYRLKASKSNLWKLIPPFLIEGVIDTAGAGDWCTAGIISKLGHKGVKSFFDSGLNEIENALNFGQALGAVNCIFFGARGMMYNLTPNMLENYISELILNQSINIESINEYQNTEMTSISNFKFDMIL
ncbi:carbohydrate kinase [Crocinitomicaceae bacterium CZZ-1]|uniref:Carbohydrate kinase n=1 Tax=Taishania pollutisoli TaxID=2766479 RepID=A0A8J6TTZ8_9FLAO|nr:PfkB family carbohydrate kinase [Taishania pollutisoli]MBC9813942.1 carbohydrate kinase [Taishania pollutisoli]